MGISLEQWRATIAGYFGASSPRATHTDAASTPAQPAQPPDGFFASTRLRLTWKTSALTLLFLLLAAACQSSLLMVGGVEPHPGPTKSAAAAPQSTESLEKGQKIRDGQQAILDKLCAMSTSTVVRNTLRMYDVSRSTSKIKLALNNNCNRDDLDETMRFLKTDNQDNYLKAKVVDNLVSRLQNLFPDQCQICEEAHCTEIEEKPLLQCAICRQGAHNSCVAGRLGLTMDEIPTVSNEDVFNKVNPCSIPGLHYLCTYCSAPGNYLHNPDEGKMKEKGKPAKVKKPKAPPTDAAAVAAGGVAAPSAADTDAAPAGDEEDLADDSTEEEDLVSDLLNDKPRVVRRHHKSGSVEPDPPPPHQPATSDSICQYYAKGKCRYGMKGTGCDKSHPKPCFKYLKNGVRPVRGCNKGADCSHFHITLCQTSVEKSECLDDKCKFQHLSGTRRANSRPICKSSQDKRECFDRECTLYHHKGTRRYRPESQNKKSHPNHKGSDHVNQNQKSEKDASATNQQKDF